MSSSPSQFHGLFRREAWDYHVAQGQRGRLLQLTTGWTTWAACLLFALGAVVVALALVCRVDDVAIGSAVVRSDGTVIAMLPARARRRLRDGAPLRFSPQGTRGADHALTVDAVGDESVAPADARRVVGGGIDRVRIDGPVVIVRAHAPASTAPLLDDTRGIAEVRLGAQPLLLSLIPMTRLRNE